jgi:hypothetical protein
MNNNKLERTDTLTATGSGGHYAPSLVQPVSRPKPGLLCFALAGTAVLPFVAFGAGTGSVAFDCDARKYLQTGACYVVSSKEKHSGALARNRVIDIKKNLQITTTDLARFLLVERPSVYQWLAGTQPRQKNLERINALGELASNWSARGLGSIRPYLKHRVGDTDTQLEGLLEQQPLPELALRSAFDRLTINEGMPVTKSRPSLSDRLAARGFEPADASVQTRKRIASVRSTSAGEE